MMDITSFVVKHRNDALLVGDYGIYRQKLSRQLLAVRRRLARTSAKGKKYAPRPAITPHDVSSNSEFIELILLTAERAWAHAMYMKSMHAADSSNKAITGATKSHIKSRLRKAEQHASYLAKILKDESCGASPRILLEADAYRTMLRGSLEFEAQQWAKCIACYSDVHVVYTSLAKISDPTQGDVFRELLSATIDPSVRYAAYQIRLPRTYSIPRIVSGYVNKEDEMIQRVLELDPDALDFGATTAKQEGNTSSKDVPKTISWRSRTVNLEDANIAQALAQVALGEQSLAETLADKKKGSKEKATAYDKVLNPSQDAVDATKTAIDEMTADGVVQGDQRMQALQITRTAVNYSLVGWRVGRNRTFCGAHDGASLETEDNDSKSRRTTKSKALGEENNGRKLARLRERVVLYDSTLQSLDSIKQLPGVAADASLMADLESRRHYFAALRCLAIARSHAILHKTKNALSIFSLSLSAASKVSGEILSLDDKPLGLEVTKDQAHFLQRTVEGLVSQYQALTELEKLTAEVVAVEKSHPPGLMPLIERLDEYPTNNVDLTNLVVYPPRVRPIPVKPIFLDLAWNYVDYPGRRGQGQDSASGTLGSHEESADKKETRRGWFGFAR